MKAWKVVGYVFVCLGALCFLYGFLAGLTETINPSTALSVGSSGSAVDSFFSVFLSAIGPWMVLASVLLVVGGVELFVGREKNVVKLSSVQENINERFEMLEKAIDGNFQAVTMRLDAIEEKQKQKES